MVDALSEVIVFDVHLFRLLGLGFSSVLLGFRFLGVAILAEVDGVEDLSGRG